MKEKLKASKIKPLPVKTFEYKIKINIAMLTFPIFHSSLDCMIINIKNNYNNKKKYSMYNICITVKFN